MAPEGAIPSFEAMKNGDRESTQDWLVPEEPSEGISVARGGMATDELAALDLPPVELSEARAERSHDRHAEGFEPQPGDWRAGAEILAEAERAAAQASESASRAGASSSAAEALLRRVEQAVELDREESRAATDAAVSADRAVAAALAVQERYGQDFDRLHTASAEAAAHALTASESAERAGAAALSAQARVEAEGAKARSVLTGLAQRVEKTLASLEARERAMARRAEEAEREEGVLRDLSRRADRIMLALRVLEEDAGRAMIRRETPSSGGA